MTDVVEWNVLILMISGSSSSRFCFKILEVLWGYSDKNQARPVLWIKLIGSSPDVWLLLQDASKWLTSVFLLMVYTNFCNFSCYSLINSVSLYSKTSSPNMQGGGIGIQAWNLPTGELDGGLPPIKYKHYAIYLSEQCQSSPRLQGEDQMQAFFLWASATRIMQPECSD